MANQTELIDVTKSYDTEKVVQTSLVEMSHRELRVSTTLEQDSIIPTQGKRIRVFAFNISQQVTAALTSTLRSTLAFGTGNTADSSKILSSYRMTKGEDTQWGSQSGLNVVGAIDEPVVLTNITFTGGGVITRAVVFYTEE